MVPGPRYNEVSTILTIALEGAATHKQHLQSMKTVCCGYGLTSEWTGTMRANSTAEVNTRYQKILTNKKIKKVQKQHTFHSTKTCIFLHRHLQSFFSSRKHVHEQGKGHVTKAFNEVIITLFYLTSQSESAFYQCMVTI